MRESAMAKRAPDEAPSILGRRQDAAAGLIISLALLPALIASGVIAYGPLGADFLPAGVAASFWAVIVGATVAALLSTSSFLVSYGLPSLAAVQASFCLSLLAHPAIAGRPALVLPALAASVVLAGLIIVLIALTGVARIIKYAPHPVLAGFKNGIAGSVILLQLKPFLDVTLQQSGPLPFLKSPTQLAAVLAVAALIAVLARYLKKVPAPLVGLVIAALAFFGLRLFQPGLDVGSTLANLRLELPPPMPLIAIMAPEVFGAMQAVAPPIILTGFVLAVLSTMQTLLGFSVAKSLGEEKLSPTRDLVGLGLGMTASGAVGGLAICVASNHTCIAYRNGGRTRWVMITIAAVMLAAGTLGATVLALVPVVAIVGLVVQSTLQLFDNWSIALARRLTRARSWGGARRDWFDLAIVSCVMLVTIFVSPLVGVGLGILLSCLVFIVNMSRPLLRRRSSGAALTSKRVRSREQADLLRATGERRVVLELNGVLFFGNAEALADQVSALLPVADMVLLDCRSVTDIDASGTVILRGLMEKAAKQKRRVLLCNVAPALKARFERIAVDAKQPAPFVDLDTALEWMEEHALAIARGPDAGSAPAVALDEHDLVRGLAPEELRVMAAKLSPRAFEAGAILCNQGDDGDRMWLLTKGSVSVRIATDDPRGTRRLASIAQGTTVGEMALIESGTRAATIVANEDVECLELSKAAYREILDQHPAIAAKLFGNLLREMASRIRDNHIELREAVS